MQALFPFFSEKPFFYRIFGFYFLTIKPNSMKYCMLHKHEDHHSVTFSSLELASSPFQELGHDGGGYDWQSVLQYHLQQENKELLQRFRFDCEGSMFCAYGKDVDALKEVVTLLEYFVDNPDKLKAIIPQVPDELWD